MKTSPTCIRCGKKPGQIAEYRDLARNDYPPISPDEYIRLQEGTYNPDINKFACTECYIELGSPTRAGYHGWKAGDMIPLFVHEKEVES